MPDPISLQWSRRPLSRDDAKPVSMGTYSTREEAEAAIRQNRAPTDVYMVVRERGSDSYAAYRYQFEWGFSSPFNLPDLEELKIGDPSTYQEVFIYDTDGQMGVPRDEGGLFNTKWVIRPAKFRADGSVQNAWGEWDAHDVDSTPTTRPAPNPNLQLEPPKVS